ncbi:6860_t:CDS:2 [Ambispora leptoticha]|uniref:Maltase n=1 Tax=Ambispora leptoticha TaxID=144679 RepID=A0A9N8YRB4_9GLOM|nr:6860_t:CDS:2 [Ambispora leptoticha]
MTNAPQSSYELKDIRKTSNSIHGNLVLSKHHKDTLPNYGPALENLTFTVEYQTPHRLHICISDAEGLRWRVPESVVAVDRSLTEIENCNYSLNYNASPFGFSVSRKNESGSIFDTIGKNLIFKDQYIELSTSLPLDANIYGLGEVVSSFKRGTGRFTIFTRDAACPENENLYGAHPFYIELRDGKAHGVLLLNSNGMDVIYDNGIITYKVIGGILDFYVFLGPTPQEVVEQYAGLIGRPCFIPYWSLGFHQCRWGYTNIEKIDEIVSQYEKAKIPMEVVWIDLDYMDAYKVFTFHPEHFPPEKFAPYLEKLHECHRKLVVIVDPGIKVEDGYAVYDEGLKRDVFIKRADGNNFVGRVWPGETVFPDWFHPETQQYWTEIMAKWLGQVPIDGIWIDMNELANFVNGDISHETNHKHINVSVSLVQHVKQTIATIVQRVLGFSSTFIPHSINNPPYAINNFGNESPLFTRTSPMDGFHKNGVLEYDAHNLFGHMEGIATYNALRTIRPDKRPFVLSRSTFPGSGKFVAHWLGDNESSWRSLEQSIPGILSFQLFAIPLVGADICGFNGVCAEELAIRWAQLGSFYPFCRNHNSINMPGQEFYLVEKVKQAAKFALEIRYRLLPYWYTGFYRAYNNGSPVISPLWFLEPEGKDTWDIDKQFLVGKGLLVTPVTREGALKVTGYFPPGIWYDFFTGVKQLDIVQGVWKELEAPLEVIPVHVYGGSIVPMHVRAGLTTHASRETGIQLLIALDRFGSASGELYLDDGETPPENLVENYSLLTLTVRDSVLKVEGIFRYDGPGSFIDEILIYGIAREVKEIAFKNTYTKVIERSKIDWSGETGRLFIRGLGISLDGGFSISW